MVVVLFVTLLLFVLGFASIVRVHKFAVERELNFVLWFFCGAQTMYEVDSLSGPLL